MTTSLRSLWMGHVDDAHMGRAAVLPLGRGIAPSGYKTAAGQSLIGHAGRPGLPLDHLHGLLRQVHQGLQPLLEVVQGRHDFLVADRPGFPPLALVSVAHGCCSLGCFSWLCFSWMSWSTR